MKASSFARILVIALSLLLPLQGMAGVLQACGEGKARASHETHDHVSGHVSHQGDAHEHAAQHDDTVADGSCGHCAVSPCCHASGIPVEAQPALAGSSRFVVVLPAMSSQLPATPPRSGPERPPRFSA